jgi:hypothetical protein
LFLDASKNLGDGQNRGLGLGVRVYEHGCPP